MLTVVVLPIDALLRARAIDVGLVTRSWPGWGWDVARSAAIGAALAGSATAAGIALMRRIPRRWWIPASGLVVALGAAFVFAGPLVLDPVFNRFERLPDGPVREQVLELARRADVQVGEVYVVDASKRTTAANAYVTGLGSSKRVVLYDTLLRDFPAAETRLVVAHELGARPPPRRAERAPVPRARRAAGHVRGVAASRAPLGPDDGLPAGPSTVPGAVRVGRARRVLDRHRVQPALPARGGARRRLRAAADR